MLISRKVTQDKREVTDFRHLNVRIPTNSLAYPLLKDPFSVLGSSRCKVLLVLDLKDAFHLLRLLENSKKILQDTSILRSQYLTLNLAIIHKCYITLFTEQKYCEAIMDDILLFNPSKKSHIAKLKYLLKALLKNGLKISPKKCQLFRTELQYMGNIIFINPFTYDYCRLQ